MTTLVLGGARSGKSAVAERLAAGAGPVVTYLATTSAAADDDDLAARVAAHRARRPSSWLTVETGRDLVAALTATGGAVLVDSLTAWVAASPEFAVDADGLCRALAEREGRGDATVVVSDEVGLGVHPSTVNGRCFRDALGALNQRVAAAADRVLLVVAGRALELGAGVG